MEQTDAVPDAPKLAAADVRRRWDAMCANLKLLEGGTLSLLAHKGATDEQILSAARRYRETMSLMKDMLLQLQERYPRKGNIFSPAWRFESLSGLGYRVKRKE